MLEADSCNLKILTALAAGFYIAVSICQAETVPHNAIRLVCQHVETMRDDRLMAGNLRYHYDEIILHVNYDAGTVDGVSAFVGEKSLEWKDEIMTYRLSRFTGVLRIIITPAPDLQYTEIMNCQPYKQLY